MFKKGRKMKVSATCMLIVFMLTSTVFILPGVKAAGTLFPRASSTPDTNIDAIDMSGASLSERFMIASLQGLVNRVQPRIFVISRPIVDDHTVARGNATFNDGDTNFWLDKLVAQGYTRVTNTDKYQLVKKYSSTLSGCIIYDPNIVSYSGDIYSFKPSDANMATINVTAMLCAKYNAIALTTAQRDTLINTYGVTLNILFDTRNQWTTWDDAYNYAYNNLRADMRTDIIAHVPTFYFSMMDYTIQHKIFTYHRVLPYPTSAQNALEDSILGITPVNTPVIGVWALNADEGNLVAKVTNAGKFFTVTHESFNLSWTCGLPLLTLTNTPKRNLALDPTKVYVACTVTEGDNASYAIMSMQTNYSKTSRTSYPMGWELTTTMRELAPNVASYYYNNLSNNYIVCPVTGVGYTNPMPPASSKAGFFDLTNTYMQAADTEVMRTMFDNTSWASEYTNISSVKGVLRGYRGTDGGIVAINGKPVFGNHDFYNEKDTIKNYNGATPAFFSISLEGWHNVSDDWKDWCATLPSKFVVVTPAELVKLYSDYMSNTKMVTASSSVENSDWGTAKAIDGQRSSVVGSMGWSSDSNTQVNHTEWAKLCLGSTQTINRVDLYPRNDGVNTGYGFPIDFTIKVSTDDTNWTTVVTRTGYPLPGNAVQSFTFDAQSARYVKIEGTSLRYNPNDSLNPYRMQFAEIEVYNSGATLYSEDFNDGLAQNWTVVSGIWAVESNEYSGKNLNNEALAYYSLQNFDNFTYTGTLRYVSDAANNDAYVLFRYQDSNNYYMLYLARSAGNQYLRLYKKVGGIFTRVGNQIAYNPPLDTNINFTITCNGSSINASVNDGTNNLSVSATDSTFSNGKIGLRVYLAHVHYDNITVR